MTESADLRVAELGDSLATAWSGRLLRAVGAEVIKLVPTPGATEWPDRSGPARADHDPAAIYLDRGKQVVTIDWDSPAGLDQVKSVLAGVDVVVTPLTADELHRRGLDSATLSQHPPALVVAHGTLFGENGRYRRLRGNELQALALSGLLSMVGEPDRPPLRLGGRQAGYTLGLSLFSGIMFALYGGDMSGAVVTTSAVRSLAYLDFKSLAYFESEKKVLERGSDRGPIVLRCADGYVGFYYRPQEWEAVRRTLATPALDAPRFATQAGRDAEREALRAAMEGATTTMTKVDLYHRAQAAGMPVGAVLTVTELLDDPQYRAREFLERHEVPEVGSVLLPGVPWLVDGKRPRVAGAALAGTGSDSDTRPASRGRLAAVPDPKPTSAPSHGGALRGLRVLDLSSITAGGRSTQLLADFGAEVIKLESESRPDPFRHWSVVTGSAALGDLASPPFRVVGRNKRAIAVDLKDPRGREVCRRLVQWADLVVENFRRGVMERLGLDFETLRSWNERIVLLSLSSQGSTGPEAEYVSFGVTLEALGGLMSVTGYDPATPAWSTPKVNYPDQVVSLLAPGLAVWGVLHSRSRGRGAWIDLSQRETVTALLGEHVVAASASGRAPSPRGNQAETGIDLLCRCAGDDEWLALSLTNDSEWAALCEVIGRPELRLEASLATASARVEREQELIAVVEEWTARQEKRTAMWQLQARGVPAAAVLRASELAAEDADRQEAWQVRAPLPDGIGDETQFGWPFEVSPDGGPAIRCGPPHLGEHTRQILAELGYPPAEIDTLHAARVVASTTVESNHDGNVMRDR